MPSAFHLVVRLGVAHVALPLTQVVETTRVPVLLPALPAPGVVGLATLRGEPVPVLDLAVLLGRDPATPSAAQRLVRVRLAEGQRAALLVDAVLGVHSLEALEPIALPGGEERRLGRFDTAFAQLLELGGLVPESALLPAAAASPEVPA